MLITPRGGTLKLYTATLMRYVSIKTRQIFSLTTFLMDNSIYPVETVIQLPYIEVQAQNFSKGHLKY